MLSKRLREVSSPLGQDHAGEIHVPGAIGDYATLCGLAGEEHEFTEVDAAPTCAACLTTIRAVLCAAPPRVLLRWARSYQGGEERLDAGD